MYEGKTDDDLVAMSQELLKQEDAVRAQRAAIAKELRRRAAARALQNAGIVTSNEALDAVVQGQTLTATTSMG